VSRIPVVLVAAACLSGCAAAPAVTLGGAGASIFTAARQATQDVDAVLAADAPIKRAICAEHREKSPGFAAWCANIPTDMAGLIRQWAAVGIIKATEGDQP
jgi:hypothetical protein